MVFSSCSPSQFETDDWVQQRSCELSGLKASLNAVTAVTKQYAMQHHHLVEVRMFMFPHTTCAYHSRGLCVCVLPTVGHTMSFNFQLVPPTSVHLLCVVYIELK